MRDQRINVRHIHYDTHYYSKSTNIIPYRLRNNRMMETKEVLHSVVNAVPVKLTRRALNTLETKIKYIISKLKSEDVLQDEIKDGNLVNYEADQVADEILIENLSVRDPPIAIPAISSTYVSIAMNHDAEVAAAENSNKENIVVANKINEHPNISEAPRKIVKAKPKQSQLSDPIFLRKGVNDKEASSHNVIKQLLYT